MLPVYGAAEAELTKIQCFLDRCRRRRYISHCIDIHDLLEKQDKKICTKVMGLEGHPLVSTPGFYSNKATREELYSYYSRL